MPLLLSIPNSPPRSLGAVICDNDGLLVDTEPLAIAAGRVVLARYGVALSAADLDDMFGLRLDATVRLLLERFALPITPADLAAEKTAIMDEMIRTSLRPRPGARELVAWLAAWGVPHALATSGLRSHAALCLQVVGLADAFAIRVTGEDVTHAKPAPALFLEAARRLGFPPADCLVLEDASNGVAAALAAGMPVVAVPGHETAHLPFPTPTATATSLTQVLGWLDSDAI